LPVERPAGLVVVGGGPPAIAPVAIKCTTKVVEKSFSAIDAKTLAAILACVPGISPKSAAIIAAAGPKLSVEGLAAVVVGKAKLGVKKAQRIIAYLTMSFPPA
jgi:hypothetical protein